MLHITFVPLQKLAGQHIEMDWTSLEAESDIYDNGLMQVCAGSWLLVQGFGEDGRRTFQECFLAWGE